MKLTTLAGILLLGVSATSFADPYPYVANPSPYFGISGGQSDYGDSNMDKPGALAFFAGFNFNQNIGAEVSYNDFGKSNFTDMYKSSVQADSVGIAAKFSIPLQPNVQVYALAGVHSWNADYTYLGQDVGTDHGSDSFFGAGITMKLNNQFGAGLRYTKYDVDKNNIAVTSLNGEFYF